MLWKKSVGDRSECPGAQSHCVAPEQVQHWMEATVTRDGSKLTLDKTLVSAFCLEDRVLAYSSVTEWSTFQGDEEERGKFYPGSGMTPTKSMTVILTEMKHLCPEIPILGSSSPDCSCPYSHQWPGSPGELPAIHVTGASPRSLVEESTERHGKCSPPHSSSIEKIGVWWRVASSTRHEWHLGFETFSFCLKILLLWGGEEEGVSDPLSNLL